jgi:DNA-binding MarR family transcriptional regulator
VERIADDIGVNRRTVQRALRRLEAAGLIRTQVARDGGNLTSHYYLLPQKRPIREIHFEDTEPANSNTDRGGAETAPLDSIGAASEAEKGRSLRRPNTLPSEGKEYARAKERDAAPRKGAAASHRRTQENDLPGYFRQIERLASQPIDDEDYDDLYDRLKRERDQLSKTDFLALIEDHRSQLSAGEYRGLKKKV